MTNRSKPLYKVLADRDGTPAHGGTGRWYMPRRGRPGKWMPRLRDPVPCERGYHYCDGEAQLLEWLGSVICEVEVRGVIVRAEDKCVAEQARIVRVLPWDARAARLYACDCAEHVAHHAGSAEAACCATIEVARRYARGEATEEERAAAWAAASAAAGAAAGAAAWAAVRNAAGAAAWAVARNAAWAAARNAAWAAARNAAWAAAWAVARNAAWAAAWAAERQWQAARLVEMLAGKAGA
jgi:hypothetical protein